MILRIILQALITILSAYVESIRIKKTWGKVININKIITNGIMLVGTGLIAWLTYTDLKDLIFFGIMAAFERGVLYDPFLNKFRELKVDYQSDTTNSKLDKLEKLLHWGFWKQRRIYLYSLIGIIIIYYIDKLLQNTTFWFK